MKRIMTVVICVVAALAFSTNGALAEKKLKAGVDIEIKFEDNTKIKFLITYDEQGIPELIPRDNGEWTSANPPPNVEVISVHHENPCYVCIGGRCWKKTNC